MRLYIDQTLIKGQLWTYKNKVGFYVGYIQKSNGIYSVYLPNGTKSIGVFASKISAHAELKRLTKA